MLHTLSRDFRLLKFLISNSKEEELEMYVLCTKTVYMGCSNSTVCLDFMSAAFMSVLAYFF